MRACSGFGFVTYEERRDAEEAVKRRDGFEVFCLVSLYLLAALKVSLLWSSPSQRTHARSQAGGRRIKVDMARAQAGGPRPGGGGGGFGGGFRDNSCNDFKQGRCTRGSSCRFSHDGAPSGGSSSYGGGGGGGYGASSGGYGGSSSYYGSSSGG